MTNFKPILLIFLSLILLSLVGLSGCKKGEKIFSKSESVEIDNIKGFWVLASMNGANVDSLFLGAKPTLSFDFDGNKISGSGGCNTFFGDFSLDNNDLKISDIGNTQIACLEENKEDEFFKLLSKPSKLLLENGELRFKQDGIVVLVFTQSHASDNSDSTDTRIEFLDT